MVSSSDNNDVEQLPLNLLDNALDFLLSATEAVHRDESLRSLKDAVTHLANGIELLFKARLACENWRLIFSDRDQASYDKLDKADFKSVDFPNAIERLEQIVGVRIAEPDISRINSLRKLRNRLTHFTARLDSAQTKSLVAKSMSFSVEFCEQQNMVTPDVESKLSEILVNLTKLQEFVDDRMKAISSYPGWEDAMIWECPECWQETLVVDGGDADCKFCNHKADPQELADSHSEGSVEDCPECGAELTFTFVFYGDDGEWVCFSCGESGKNYDQCMKCGRMKYFSDTYDGTVCKSCWAYVMGSNL